MELSEYETAADARAQIGHFIEEAYLKKQIHSSLGYRTPAEFEAAWIAAAVEDSEVSSRKVV